MMYQESIKHQKRCIKSKYVCLKEVGTCESQENWTDDKFIDGIDLADHVA